MTTAPTQISGRRLIETVRDGEQARLEAGRLEEVLGDPLPRQRVRVDRVAAGAPRPVDQAVEEGLAHPDRTGGFVDPQHRDHGEPRAAGQYFEMGDGAGDGDVVERAHEDAYVACMEPLGDLAGFGRFGL